MKASELCNCQEDNNEFLNLDILSDVTITEVEGITNDTEIEHIDLYHNKETDEDSSNDDEFVTNIDVNREESLEKCTVSYICGYLVKRCIEKYQCKTCEENLLEKKYLTQSNYYLIMEKMFSWAVPTGGLKKPSLAFYHFISSCIEIYQNKINNIIWKKNIRSKLTKIIEKKHANEIKLLESCVHHYDYMIQLLLRTLIFKKCKWINRIIRDTSIKPHQKLSILQNK